MKNTYRSLFSRIILSISITALACAGIAYLGTPAPHACVQNAKNPCGGQRALIFDMGGVLFDTNTSKASKHIGIMKLLSAKMNGVDLHDLKRKLYELLSTLAPRTSSSAQPCDEQGHVLPTLMCDWQTGRATNKELRELVLTAIEQDTEFFVTKQEKNIISSIVEIMFTPELMAKTRKPCKKMMKLAREHAENGDKIFILSNWDPESFALLREDYKEFFDLFDGIIISGDIGMMKPNPHIYTHLLTHYDLQPDNCVFIDDRPENIQAAQHCGIAGITCIKEKNKPRAHLVREALANIQFV